MCAIGALYFTPNIVGNVFPQLPSYLQGYSRNLHMWSQKPMQLDEDCWEAISYSPM